MDNVDKLYGLNRHLSFKERWEVEAELSLTFTDVYDSIEAARDNVRALEQTIDRIFLGDANR